jgi:hypothetical protein
MAGLPCLGLLLLGFAGSVAPGAPTSGGGAEAAGTVPPVAASTGEAPPAEATPFPVAPPPPPPPEIVVPELRRYGDRGTPEVALGLGYSSSAGLLAAGGFRYFVLDGVAPGIEGSYVSGGRGGPAYGLLLAGVRLVPLRTSSVALVLTGRGGRVFLGDHDDAWGVGGEVGAILMLGAGAGLELGYEVLRLLPGRVCADLDTCVLQGPVLGLRIVL